MQETNMGEHSAEILQVVSEIRELVRLMAEPAIAERDRKLRAELRRIVGSSEANSGAVILMDGTRSQKEIHEATGINRGNLSTLVKRLGDVGLVKGDSKQPQLVISIPANFFDPGTQNG